MSELDAAYGFQQWCLEFELVHSCTSVLLQWSGNQFAGSLPDAWAHSIAIRLDFSNNNLTGPAFPQAWLELGAMADLEFLELSGNPGITGTLPDVLDWPNLRIL